MPAKNVKVDDHVWKELRAKLGPAAKARVKVGVLESEGAKPHDGDPRITLAELAAIHEYGAPRAGIPARSYLRRTFEEGRSQLEQTMVKLARGVVGARLEVEDALNQLGAWGAAAVKNRIKAHIPPPLKAATVKKKLSAGHAGGSTPLVATGQLLNSITWEIKK